MSAADDVAGQSERILREVRVAGAGVEFDPRLRSYTGSLLQKVSLDNGETVIVKHLAPEGDWLARATGGVGRPQLLWRSGLLQRLDPVVEHGMIGIVDFGDHEAMVMRDLSAWLFPPDVMLSRSDVDSVLARMATFHDFAASLKLPPLCTVRERCNLVNPAFHRGDRGPHAVDPEPLEQTIDGLASRAGGAAGAALSSFFDDLVSFEARIVALTSRPTLVHGDTKPENLGETGSRLVAVDWGELTGSGPAEIDVLRFAFASYAVHTDVEPAEMVEMYNNHSGHALDHEVLRLAALAVIATYGVGLVLGVRDAPNELRRDRAKERLRSALAEFRRLFAD